MKDTTLVITFLGAAALAVGCKPTDGQSAGESKDSGSAAAQYDKAKTETKEAAQAVRDYTYAQKNEFVAETKKELAEIQEELDRLSAKIDKSSGAAKADAKIKLEMVREKWAQAKNQLEKAENATESTWDDVKGGFRKAYSELKDTFGVTRKWLSEKIAS